MISVLRRPAALVSARSRQGKLDYLRELIPAGASVLTVGVSGNSGVGTQSLLERGLLEHAEVVGLTYEQMDGSAFSAPLVRGDARRLPFADHSFDWVVSNAVIEHLGGPGGSAAMLAESERVARCGWVHTTPNRRFPVETHTGVPLAHWLPQTLRESAFRRLGRPFPQERYHLFSPRTLATLWPQARVDTVSRVRPRLTLMLVREKAAAGPSGQRRPAR